MNCKSSIWFYVTQIILRRSILVRYSNFVHPIFAVWRSIRQKLNRKLKAGQLEDLKKMISSTSTMSDEMKDFYEKFDSIILHLYPDFVEHFNSLLRPEEHIEVKSGRLNTELRIHA